MKKLIILLAFISFIFLLTSNSSLEIPTESIRFRIIASSNSFKDQLNKIEDILNKYDISYKINFGQNFFPQKNYQGITYPAGNYESLVITLGEGLGDNWWCVLYPPLCLIENKFDSSNIEYRSYIKDIILKNNHY